MFPPDERRATHTLEAYEAALRQGFGAGWSGYAKYGTSYGMDMVDPASNSVFRLRPDWVFALNSRDFSGSPTRFTFGPPGPATR